jgi:MerR family copper efflux transcriptional regulator
MKATNCSMTVGALAKQAGVKIDTIRYYERRGLLRKPPRTNSGYRTFTPAAVDRLRFIKQAQALGFTLTEVNQLLALRLSPDMTCTDVRKPALHRNRSESSVLGWVKSSPERLPRRSGAG